MITKIQFQYLDSCFRDIERYFNESENLFRPFFKGDEMFYVNVTQFDQADMVALIGMVVDHCCKFRMRSIEGLCYAEVHPR